MNNIIRILSENIINKIAAGEVIERPGSVVKELIENSIDAGADHITIAVKNSGRDLIQISDNGIGMTKGDAITAFERHATSKISDLDDLNSIETLGFRGEALASIAAVSRVELKTRRQADEIGNQINISGGKLEETKPVNINPGTQISVKNLFFNTPARRSFLKTPATESAHIFKYVKRFLLAKPQIAFKFYNDDKLIYDLQGESLEMRIFSVLGEKNEGDFLKVEHQMSDMHLYGFIGRPEAAGRDRQRQFLFLNGRNIINKNINYAIYMTYGEMIRQNTYPPFVLYLKIDPKLVDVNVHPTKAEVRFAIERVILNFFQQSIRQTFENSQIIPNVLQDQKPAENEIRSLQNDFTDFKVSSENSELKGQGDVNDLLKTIRGKKDFHRDQLTLSYSESKFKNVNGIINAKTVGGGDVYAEERGRPIWQVLNSYILTEISSGLIFIDQYRAHYRILYEKIIKNADKSEFWGSQQLLFPQNFDLTLEDYIIFKEIAPYLEKIGFVISPYSGHTVCIEAIPNEVKIGSESSIIFDLITAYKHEIAKNNEVFERFARAFSQKNAVKKGEDLRLEEMTALIDHLFACEQPYYTPDGKLIIATMAIAEIENKFK